MAGLEVRAARTLAEVVEALRPATGFTQSIATVDELAQFGARHVRVIRSTRVW